MVPLSRGDGVEGCGERGGQAAKLPTSRQDHA
jgi:hypothetical protein